SHIRNLFAPSLGIMLVLCALILFCFGIETRKVSLEEISTLA
ncbi:hypothetical protein, partial [Citrobacter youngae]